MACGPQVLWPTNNGADVHVADSDDRTRAVSVDGNTWKVVTPDATLTRARKTEPARPEFVARVAVGVGDDLA